MKISLLSTMIRKMLLHWQPLFWCAAMWMAVLMGPVMVSSFAPEIAFVWALLFDLRFVQRCRAGAVRVPMEGLVGEVVCMTAHLLRRSKMDLFVPLLFTSPMVWGFALFVWVVGLRESEEEVIG